MVNLSSEGDKRLLIADYRRRLVVVASVLLAILLLVSNILMLSLYGVAVYRLVATEKLYVAESVQVGNKDLADQTKMMATLKASLETFRQAEQLAVAPQFSLVASRLERRRVPGIKITNIDLTNDSGQNIRVGLRGVSSSRKALTSYIESLRSDPAFGSVESPIANLLRDTTSSFTVNLVVRPDGLAVAIDKKI